MIKSVAERGGDASVWDDLKKKAEAAVAAGKIGADAAERGAA
jgi:hypothetical protein